MPIDYSNMTGQQLADLLTKPGSLPRVYSLVEVFLDESSDRTKVESWRLGKRAKSDVFRPPSAVS